MSESIFARLEKISLLGFTAIALLTLFSHPLAAAPGGLDLTFNGTGKVTTDFGSGTDFGNHVAVQSDGRIVVAGWTYHGSSNDFALVRYTAGGALDPSFGTGGRVTTDIGINSYDIGQSIAVQSDGKIVVAGYSSNGSNLDFALVRYTVSGALDPNFGTGGKVTTPIGSSDDVSSSLAVQSDGKIVVAGYSVIGSTDDFALVRYTASGALDLEFGTSGKVTTPIGGNERGYSVAVQSDGKIVVAGFSGNGTNADFALVRYTASGALDVGFSSDGKVTTDFGGSSDVGNSMVVQSDGKIVVAGYSGSDFAMVRYMVNGTLDMGFGMGGRVTTDFTSADIGYSVAMQSDGKIIVAGYSASTSTYDFALVRYTVSGALDPSFGTGGKVTTDIGFSDNRCYSVAVQGDGKIVVAGYSYNGSTGYDFALARYLGANATGEFEWPARNGYAHPLSKTSSTIRSKADAQFLSPDYETSEDRRHVGIDLTKVGGSTEGDPVYAIDDGEIVYFRRQFQGDDEYPRGMYPVIFIRHHTASGQSFWGIYGHCILENSLYARPANYPPSQREEQFLDGSPIAITKGKPIGKIITVTGSGPHLHFGLNTSATQINFYAGDYGWGRVPIGTADSYIRDTLKWQAPINQDSPNFLGFLGEPTNSNNELEQIATWQSKVFAGTNIDPSLQAASADADGDGIINRDEYALGLDPLSGANEGQPKLEIIVSGGYSFPGFRHLRRRNATDLSYSVLTSDDMVNWGASGAQLVQFGLPEACPDGDCEIVTFRLSPYIPSALKKFFSLSVFHAP